jgi:hypothetical protein
LKLIEGGTANAVAGAIAARARILPKHFSLSTVVVKKVSRSLWRCRFVPNFSKATNLSGANKPEHCAKRVAQLKRDVDVDVTAVKFQFENVGQLEFT